MSGVIIGILELKAMSVFFIVDLNTISGGTGMCLVKHKHLLLVAKLRHLQSLKNTLKNKDMEDELSTDGVRQENIYLMYSLRDSQNDH